MSRGRHRKSFDLVSKFDRGRIVAYGDCVLSIREIGQHGQIRIWKHRDERLLNCCVLHRHTCPAPGIIVWGGIELH
ncbi:hypothetical protein TNCV_1888841 [Trichonephila clavipes]|nr:hypothetical protein TNCV_1888841 [Trichonephila clavipes]